MHVKKHTLFKWDSLFFGDWIWLVMIVAPFAAFLRAIQYNYSEGRSGIDTGGWVSMPLVVATFWAITFLRYWHRAKFVKSIKFYTKHGMAVVFEEKSQERLSMYPEGVVEKAIDDATDYALNFFVAWDNLKKDVGEQATYSSVSAALNGGVLSIVDAPFNLLSMHGPLPPSLQHKMMGITYLNRIVIAWDGDRVRTLMDLGGLLKHEMGHYCLEQLGHLDVIGGEDHHHTFEKIKYPN